MSGIINLNKHRKARRRAESRREADANAARFGRSKADKALDEARQAKAKRDLDAHERDQS